MGLELREVARWNALEGVEEVETAPRRQVRRSERQVSGAAAIYAELSEVPRQAAALPGKARQDPHPPAQVGVPGGKPVALDPPVKVVELPIPEEGREVHRGQAAALVRVPRPPARRV